MKATKFHQIALTRLAEFLDVELIDAPRSGKGHLTLDLRSRVPEKYRGDTWTMDGFVYTGSKKMILARLVIMAMEPPSVGWAMAPEVIREVMRLRDVETDTGLAAHEYQTLKTVTLLHVPRPRTGDRI